MNCQLCDAPITTSWMTFYPGQHIDEDVFENRPDAINICNNERGCDMRREENEKKRLAEMVERQQRLTFILSERERLKNEKLALWGKSLEANKGKLKERRRAPSH